MSVVLICPAVCFFLYGFRLCNISFGMWCYEVLKCKHYVLMQCEYREYHVLYITSKTKCMLISQKHRRSQAHHLPPLNLNGCVVQPVKHCKYLGVWISSDLTWTKHVESVSCKARRLLALCLEHSLPSASLKLYIITLYKSQVLPIIDYACVVWDPHLQKDQYLLESVQTSALRMAS